MTTNRRRSLVSVAITSVGLMVPLVCNAQILETETARPLGRGGLEVGSNFEYQTSSEGHEIALPFAVEYGFTDRLEMLVEPVAYTAIRPKVGTRATGVGDVEVTLTYLARRESGGHRPWRSRARSSSRPPRTH